MLKSVSTTDVRYIIRKAIPSDRKIMIIADLHLGFESEYYIKGLAPKKPMWSLETINHIKKDVLENHIDKLIIIGDIEHSWQKNRSISQKRRERSRLYGIKTKKILFDKLVEVIDELNIKVTLLRGNHDIGPLYELITASKNANLSFNTNYSLSLGNIKSILFHGHLHPDIDLSQHETMICGHLHPTIWLNQNIHVFLYGYIKKELLIRFNHPSLDLYNSNNELLIKFIILPAYNKYLRGFTINNYRSINKLQSESFNIINKLLKNKTVHVYSTNFIDMGILKDLMI